MLGCSLICIRADRVPIPQIYDLFVRRPGDLSLRFTAASNSFCPSIKMLKQTHNGPASFDPSRRRSRSFRTPQTTAQPGSIKLALLHPRTSVMVHRRSSESDRHSKASTSATDQTFSDVFQLPLPDGTTWARLSDDAAACVDDDKYCVPNNVSFPGSSLVHPLSSASDRPSPVIRSQEVWASPNQTPQAPLPLPSTLVMNTGASTRATQSQRALGPRDNEIPLWLANTPLPPLPAVATTSDSVSNVGGGAGRPTLPARSTAGSGGSQGLEQVSTDAAARTATHRRRASTITSGSITLSTIPQHVAEGPDAAQSSKTSESGVSRMLDSDHHSTTTDTFQKSVTDAHKPQAIGRSATVKQRKVRHKREFHEVLISPATGTGSVSPASTFFQKETSLASPAFRNPFRVDGRIDSNAGSEGQPQRRTPNSLTTRAFSSFLPARAETSPRSSGAENLRRGTESEQHASTGPSSPALSSTSLKHKGSGDNLCSPTSSGRAGSAFSSWLHVLSRPSSTRSLLSRSNRPTSSSTDVTDGTEPVAATLSAPPGTYDDCVNAE
ncbi:hypothetical protein V8E36_008197 [Tilletia maclaganii]